MHAHTYKQNVATRDFVFWCNVFITKHTPKVTIQEGRVLLEMYTLVPGVGKSLPLVFLFYAFNFIHYVLLFNLKAEELLKL